MKHLTPVSATPTPTPAAEILKKDGAKQTTSSVAQDDRESGLPTTNSKELTAQNTFLAKSTLLTAEEATNKIRTELKAGNHAPSTLSAFEKVYANTKFSDELFPLIEQFIHTPGIDSIIKKLGEETGDNVSGTAGELYHASVLKERGYRIVSFGFELDTGTKKKSDGLETDLIAEKDGKYYLVEIKHFPGRRWFDKEKENQFASPKEWAENFLLNIKDGKSNKMQNYGVALRLICSNNPLPSIQEQVGPELEKVRDYLRQNGPTILFSYATTAALSVTKDGKRIILDETNKTKEISQPDLNVQNDRAELDQIERTVKDCAESYTFWTQFERVPFKLFNSTSRVVGGDKVIANRKIVAIPHEINSTSKKQLTSDDEKSILEILKESNVPQNLIETVKQFISSKGLIGQDFDSVSLNAELKPLGKDLKAHMQTLKQAVTKVFAM